MADTRLKDPLEREIVLHDRTWLGHIVKGHPEVRNLRAMVENAVESLTKFGLAGLTRIAGFILRRVREQAL